MKKLIIVILTTTSAVFASETNAPVATALTSTVPVLQVELIEQARLVAEIGNEAAKGFDSENHARALRAQIEGLLTKHELPVAKAISPPLVPAPQATDADATALSTLPEAIKIVPARTALKAVIQLLRTEADRLESQLK